MGELDDARTRRVVGPVARGLGEECQLKKKHPNDGEDLEVARHVAGVRGNRETDAEARERGAEQRPKHRARARRPQNAEEQSAPDDP